MNFEQFKGQLKVFFDVRQKRIAQDVEWGGPAHDDAHKTSDFLEYIDKQVGKADAANDPAALRDALISIAGLAFAAVESMDRRAALALPLPAPSYSWSLDDECFNGDHSSISDAIAEALLDSAETDPDVREPEVYVGRNEPPDPAAQLGDTVLDIIHDQLGDEVGEYSDRFDSTKEDAEELSAIIEVWASANLNYSCWRVVGARAYNVADPEYAAAKASIGDDHHG